MIRYTYRLILACLVLLAFSSSAAAEEAEQAKAFVQERTDAILQIVNRSAADEAAQNQRRSDLQTAIRGFLSFELLAERTLGSHWEARSEEERTEFTELLRELIETSYLKRLGSGSVDESAYTATYTGQRFRRGRATVEGTLAARGDRTFVEVRLQQTDDSWLIFDIVTDDVSLEESYGQSFDQIIRDEGWDALISRLRNRIEELKA